MSKLKSITSERPISTWECVDVNLISGIHD